MDIDTEDGNAESSEWKGTYSDRLCEYQLMLCCAEIGIASHPVQQWPHANDCNLQSGLIASLLPGWLDTR